MAAFTTAADPPARWGAHRVARTAWVISAMSSVVMGRAPVGGGAVAVVLGVGVGVGARAPGADTRRVAVAFRLDASTPASVAGATATVGARVRRTVWAVVPTVCEVSAASWPSSSARMRTVRPGSRASVAGACPSISSPSTKTAAPGGVVRMATDVVALLAVSDGPVAPDAASTGDALVQGDGSPLFAADPRPAPTATATTRSARVAPPASTAARRRRDQRPDGMSSCPTVGPTWRCPASGGPRSAAPGAGGGERS